MKSDEDKDKMRIAVGDILSYIHEPGGAPPPPTPEKALAEFAKLRDAVNALQYAHGAYILHRVEEALAEVRALVPSRALLVEHYVLVATKFFNLHNGVFAEVYALLRGHRTQDEAFTRRLELEIEALAKFANGQPLAVLSVGLTLVSRPEQFYNEYQTLLVHLDPVVRLELVAEMKRGAEHERLDRLSYEAGQ